MTKLKIAKRYLKYIAEDSIDVLDDTDGKVYQVWLRYGYSYDYENSGMHTRVFDLFGEALDGLEDVYLCNCADCAKKPLGTPVEDLHSA